MACVVTARRRRSSTGEAVREFCRGKIAHYKVPRYVQVVDEFPMTVTGKVQKFKLREQAIDELGLAEVETAHQACAAATRSRPSKVPRSRSASA